MKIIFGKDPGTKLIEEAVSKAVNQAAERVATDYKDYLKIGDLKKQIATLEVERDKRQEAFDRKEREIEHKVGLEKRRQESEAKQHEKDVEIATRIAKVEVRESNLAADQERFKAEMDFQRGHLEKETESLRKIVEQLMQRLPSAEIIANISGGSGGSGNGKD